MVRAIGGIAAIVFTALFAIVLVQTFNSEDLVLPTNGVTGGGTADPVSENAADYQTLAQRLQLQRWRGDARSAPSLDGTGTDVQVDYATERSPEERVAQWLSSSEGESGLLQQRRYIEGRTVAAANPVANVLTQPQGRTWRAFRNNWALFGGGLYIFGVSALLAIFLAWRGRIDIEEGASGETVPRFSLFERANHWLTAVSFILIALTGLVILYGQSLLRPLTGPDAFGTLASVSAWLHMALMVPFAIGVLVMLVVWIGHNLPTRLDWEWLKQGGGMASKQGPNPPAKKFNAGQKMIFWAVLLGGIVMVASGLTMMFPFLWVGYDGMELGQSIHVVAGLLMIGVIIGHIYIGTIGMEGAIQAMWNGDVDRNWAKEHHSLWYEELQSRGHAQTQGRPAGE